MKLLLLCFFIVLAFTEDMVKDEEWVRNYFNELKKTYDKRVAPIEGKSPGSPIKVTVSLYILDISEVDDSSMDFTAQFYFRQSWNDSRLRYANKNEVIKLRTAEDVWTPDLFFTGGRESRLEHNVHPNELLKITPNGTVFYSIRVTAKFFCPMDLRYFPHDIQKCAMKIESYAHVRSAIDIEWQEQIKAIGASKDITLHNFDLIALDGSALIENITTGEYKILSVNMTFRRKFGVFAIKLYVPFILLVSMSFISLWIKAEERGIRLTLLVIIFYFMSNIAVEVSYNIPPAPYTKGTDVWIAFCVSLVFGIFLEFIAVALIAAPNNNEILDNEGKISLNIELESKEQSGKSDSLKSHLCKFVNMFDSRYGGRGRRDASAHHIDKIFRIVFPLIFFLFNVVYWSFYC